MIHTKVDYEYKFRGTSKGKVKGNLCIAPYVHDVEWHLVPHMQGCVQVETVHHVYRHQQGTAAR